jgi:secreted protein with Ig-like and vWFA domain
VQGLTGSRAELELSLATVTSAPGTRIDKGLELAVVELLGARHRERNNPVIILLSDGLPEPGTEKRTLQIAMDARAAGIVLYTIGLGQDADADLLWLLAGDAGRTFEAPNASQLAGIYWQIAGKVLCY